VAIVSLFAKLSSITRSPQGRKLMDEAQRRARDPETRRKIEQAGRSVMSRRGGRRRGGY